MALEGQTPAQAAGIGINSKNKWKYLLQFALADDKDLRPILWGTIWFFIGLVGWVAFSVIYGIAAGFGSQIPPAGWFLVYLFGSIFFFSMPVALIVEVIRWRRRRGRKAEQMGTTRSETRR